MGKDLATHRTLNRGQQKPHSSQCINNNHTFLSHNPQTQGGRKRFNWCRLFLCGAESPSEGIATASSDASNLAPSSLDRGPCCFTPFLWAFFEEDNFCGSARAMTKRSTQLEGPLGNRLLGVRGGHLETWNFHNMPQKGRLHTWHTYRTLGRCSALQRTVGLTRKQQSPFMGPICLSISYATSYSTC